ncbi:Outer membrane receptor proteins, mostly Fe transport [Chitinophaga sp. CF118]|uniref:TonB-dependent receptor domain-containing protein n=1 Tax=Chitinophaga sp. CF118 TaxID=1884367 RepID=UPI0008E0E8B6|nr:TonB-dependent receptor [Chitinophaga sp. CF118]SFF01363.1 Outer membrane receptor proteins, mostly Fe transport [Chitinophaga sp. CF118]
MKTYYFFLFALLLPAVTLAQTTPVASQQQKDTTKKINLNEVEVKSKRPLIQMEIDKTVVNVGSMISATTSNTLEILEKTPGVLVNNSNGDISLNGRGGVLVLIDGRSTHMSSQDLANYLKTIPGGLLDKIELIDNPPARYDAAGNAIINIRMKKNKAGGFTGSLASGISQGKFTRGNHSLNLNYNHKKVNIFGNLGYTHEKNYSLDNYQTNFYDANGVLTSNVALNNELQSHNKGLNTSLGIDYAATENTTYGVQFSIGKNRRNDNFNSAGTNYSNNEPDSISKGYTISQENKTNLGANLNFLHKFGKTGRELSADANYLKYRARGDQSLQNFNYLPDGSLTGNDDFLYQLPSDINIYSVKADYVHPFKNKAKFEAGFKSSIVDNDNLADYYQIIDKQSLIDNGKSNHFKYHENINAAYVSVQKSWKQLGIQLGLRAEHTVSNGHQLGNAEVAASSFHKNYLQLFPSLFIQYKLDTLSRNSLAFSITRRINRPNYQLLNPFRFFRDQYTYTSGNPLLTPQYQYRYELKYQYKQKLRMTLSYNRFTDVIFQTTNVVDKILITKPENVNQGFMLLLNTGLSFTPAAWWNLYTDILLSRIGLNGVTYGEKLNPRTYVARINVSNQFQFGKTWSAELGAYYASIDLNGQTFTDAMFRANAGVQKKILKGKGSIRISVDDIFHSWVYHNRSMSLKQTQYYQISESDTQRVGLSFSYSFGKDTFTRKSKHRDNALDEEKSRM